MFFFLLSQFVLGTFNGRGGGFTDLMSLRLSCFTLSGSHVLVKRHDWGMKVSKGQSQPEIVAAGILYMVLGRPF